MNLLLLIIILIILLFGFVAFQGSPYVPSRKVDVRKALRELYPLNSSDLLVDIGSGDGVVLREAAKIGAHVVGYEINPIMVIISRILCRKYKNIKINSANFWKADLPDGTTVVYIFSASRDMGKILKKLRNEADRLGHPINIISYGSEFDDLKIVKNVGAYHLYRLG